MIMPKMNGRDCFMKLKEIKPQLPIILVSGFTREEDLEDMQELGLSGLIHKPFRRATLSQTLHNVLKS